MANLVLYRKYRPQTFAEIIGQEHVVQTLTNAISSGMISHAYLFSGPRGSGKCVKFDTKTVDALTGEIFTIDEIFKRKKINLLSLQSDYKLKRVQPSKYIDDGVKPCYKVNTVLGREIEVTLSHPFLTIEGWKKLSELKVGDYIGMPRVLPIFGKKKIPEHQVRLIAHLISEGSTHGWNRTVGFTNSDPILAEDFTMAAKKFRNIKVVKVDSNGTRTPTYRPVQIIRRYWINQPGQSQNSIMGFAKNLGLVGQKSKTKTIPSIIFQLTKPLISLFLRTLYSGDGGVDSSDRSTICYYSSSKQLISQIQHLLLRFGIIARIRYKPVKLKNKLYPNWALDITNRESLLIFINEIGFIGEKTKKLQQLSSYLFNRPTNPNCDVIPLGAWGLVKKEKELAEKTWVEVGKVLNYKKPKKFSSSVRFRPSRKKLRTCGEVFGSKEILNLANSDLYWDKVTQIKYSGDYQVYDLVVPKTHNFVANDFIVHNTTIARLLAKAVNCRNHKDSEFEPCDKCSSCLEIKEGRSLDLIEIDAASHRGIDEIRELRDGIKFAPTKERYKVFVIDECHQLTREAVNALLKTLEEPPSHAIFVLATTEIHKMIPTIISRCQRFDFRKLTLPEIIKRLDIISKKERAKIDRPALELIALNSGGSIRDAESLLDQALTFTGTLGREGIIKTEDIKDLLGLTDINLINQFVNFISEKSGKKAIKFLEETFERGYDPQEFAKALIRYLRQTMLLKINPVRDSENEENTQNKDISNGVNPSPMNPAIIGLTKEEQEKIQTQAEKFSSQELQHILNLFLEAENKMKYSSISQLPLELAIVDFIKPEE